MTVSEVVDGDAAEKIEVGLAGVVEDPAALSSRQGDRGGICLLYTSDAADDYFWV